MSSAGLLMLAACAGDGGPEGAAVNAFATTAPTTAASVSTTTERPATTTTTTTVERRPRKTTTTTTTAAPTTTAPPTAPPTLPQPLAPPTDEYGHEPVVELGRISIPKIGLERTMYEGIRLTTLDRGPGHWPGTAMPGQVGNVVVAGHRVSHNRDFHDLDQLEAGDQVVFTTLDGVSHAYAVTGVEVVTPADTWIVQQTPEKTATLFACHPPGSTQYRIVVHLAYVA